MRLLLYVFYYLLALAMGFVLRQKYDAWMWSKPHQQLRLRTFCARVVEDDDAEMSRWYVPPSTTDNFALFPAPSDRVVAGRMERPAAPHVGAEHGTYYGDEPRDDA